MSNIDQTTLAYINMYGVLGGIAALCEHVPEARKILGKSACSIGFAVKNGPEATLTFAGGSCLVKNGTADAAIKIPFSSPAKFNGMIDGSVTPIPTRGLTKVGFLLGKFMKLTKIWKNTSDPLPKSSKTKNFSEEVLSSCSA